MGGYWPTGGSINSLAVSGTTVYAGTSGGLFRSTVNGASWTDVSGGLRDKSVLAFAVGGSDLFAATAANGVWRYRVY